MFKEISIPFFNVINRQLSRFLGMKTVMRNTFLGERSFYCEGSVEAFRTIRYGGEETALAAVLFLLNDRDTVWDVGASIGLFSIYAAGKAQKVVSFEPDPHIYKRFNENVGLNKLENKITTYPFAIGAEVGKMALNSDGIDGFSPSLSNISRHSKTVEVEVKTMDSMIADGAEAPTVIKIDIEGAEILALQGAKKLLQCTNRPRLLFIEVHPEFLPAFESSVDQVHELLEAYNYKILSIEERGTQDHLIAISN